MTNVMPNQIPLFWTVFYKMIFNPVTTGCLLPFLLVSTKARQTLLAHAGLFQRINEKIKNLPRSKSIVWFHVASAGEYLQVKSLIRIFQNKGYMVFITVTSISGYKWLERENNQSLFFEYLPLDFTHNAKKILALIKPDALVFVKTDIWPNLIFRARSLGIPTILVCAPERNTNSPVKKSFYKFLYSGFNAIFPVTLNGESFYKELLSVKKPGRQSGQSSIIKTVGDSKYDILLERKKEKTIKLPSTVNDIRVTLGSVWPEDLEIITGTILSAMENFAGLKLIIAPHENDHKHVNQAMNLFKKYNPVLFSAIAGNSIVQNTNSRKKISEGNPGSPLSKKIKDRVIVIDTIGDLFFLYANSSIAYVGGGFSSGIHNTLEPCAMGNSVIFGPRYQKFAEALSMLKEKIAFSVSNRDEFAEIFNELILNKKKRLKTGREAGNFVKNNTGASAKLFEQIEKVIRVAKNLN